MPIYLLSQALPESVHQTDALARQLANKLSDTDKRGVLVLDLYTPESKWLPFGAWIADELSFSLANLGQGIQTIDRANLNAALGTRHLVPQDEFDPKNAIALSRATGAKTVIVGSYAAAENGIGVTLVAFRVPADGTVESNSRMLGTVRGKINLTQDVTEHLKTPLDSLSPRDGVALAGLGGTTVPECITCTPPSLMSGRDVDLVRFLREKQGAGTLQLNFIVTAEGSTTNITVSNPIGYGIDDLYVRAARNFKFKPAVDADNKPIAVRTHLLFEINTK